VLLEGKQEYVVRSLMGPAGARSSTWAPVRTVRLTFPTLITFNPKHVEGIAQMKLCTLRADHINAELMGSSTSTLPSEACRRQPVEQSASICS
jgi:hypothetical protein